MAGVRVVTIFGSAQIEENAVDYQKAVSLARMLASEGFVICNGGYGGIMEASARGAREGGGKTIGITAEEFPGRVNRWIQEERQARTWRERLFQLIETGDAYVLFDGGTGTLVEFFVVWEMANKGMLEKPIILYGPFVKNLSEMLRKNKKVIFNHQLRLAHSPQDVLKYLKASHPSPKRRRGGRG